MAELPRVPREIAVTPRVESQVSAADVAGPYQSIAKGLAGIGSFLTDHQRMVDEGALATEVEAAKTAAFQFENDANGDATAFKTSWDTYTQSRLAAIPQSVRQRYEANIASIGGAGERGVLGDKFKRDRELATNSVNAREKTLEAELADLAQQGLSNTSDYQQRHDELTTLLNEKAGNPAFAYSPANLDADVNRIEDTLTGAAVTGELQRVYAKDGYAAAQKRAQEIYDDPKSTLPVVKRLKAIQSGLSSVRSLYEADSQARRDFSAAVQQTKAALADGSLAANDPLVEDMKRQADALKDPVSRFALESAQGTAVIANGTKGLPLHDRLNFLSNGIPRSLPPPSPEQHSALTTPEGARLPVEPPGKQPGLAPAAPPGQVIGALTDQKERTVNAQGYGERLTGTITVNGHTYQWGSGGGGRGSLPFGTYKIVDFMTGAQRKAAGYEFTRDSFMLSDAKDPLIPNQAPRSGLLIHDSQAGYTAGCIGILGDFNAFQADLKAEAGKRGGLDKVVVQVGPTGGTGTPNASPTAGAGATTTGLPGYVRGVLPAARASVKDGLDVALSQADTIVTKHPLDENQVADLVDAARMVDDAAYYDRVAGVIAKSDATAAMLGTSAGDHTALLDIMRAPGPAGDEAVRIKAFDAAQATHNAMAEKLNNDPRGLGVELGFFAPGPVVNWGDLKSAGPTLNRRASEMSRLENAEGQAPNSLTILRPDETVALKAAWAQGTVEQKSALLAALADSLPPERLMAVLSGLSAEKGAPRMLAIAGALAVTSPAASKAIIRGQAALATNPKFGFDEGAADDRQKINDAFPPSIVPPGPGYLQGWQDHVEAAKAVYAEMSASAGDASGKLNEQRWKDSVLIVTGGILEHRGQKIIAPVPGMKQGDFETLLNRATAPANGVTIVNGLPTDVGVPPKGVFAGAEWPDGSPLIADQVRDLGVLHSSGDGRYVIELGKGSGVIAQQRLPTDRATGRVIVPFELNLKTMATAPQQPARVQDYVPPPPPLPAGLPTTVPRDVLQGILVKGLQAMQDSDNNVAVGTRALEDALAKAKITPAEADQIRGYWNHSFDPGQVPSTGNRPQGALETPRGAIQVADASGAVPQSAIDRFTADAGLAQRPPGAALIEGMQSTEPGFLHDNPPDNWPGKALFEGMRQSAPGFLHDKSTLPLLESDAEIAKLKPGTLYVDGRPKSKTFGKIQEAPSPKEKGK